ncbi:serine hydrolase domain-containing protein [Luteirhabdus pelagi]|uniref:serine hydrolase domain-containing protein n=1 Tax=Luteirhabdus pelagi TaxID=2792783 RepID=UPI00193999D7|nr:serine hydrolase domain-containing protein [Luteirhabdus pelagi]
MKKFLSAFLFTITTTIGLAQIPSEVKNEVEIRINSADHPSIAIGLFENGKEEYYVSGFLNSSEKIKATEETLYEIGSITKTITSLLLAQLSVEGKVQIDEPIAQYLPDSLKLEDAEGIPITFKHIATHTSGLTRMPFGYLPKDVSNPYEGYLREHLFLYLTRFGPEKVGQKRQYSNLAVGLLGETLSIIENIPYKELVAEKILQPLQLKSTYFEIPQAEKPNFAQGYKNGEATSEWTFQAMAGAGALRMNVKDLLKYGKSYLYSSPLDEAQRLVTKTHYKSDEGVEMGLGWFKNGSIISHGGGTYGFRSYIAIDLEHDKAVAVLVNSGEGSPEDIGNFIMNPKESPLFSSTTETIPIAAEALSNYTGTYFNEQYSMTFEISVANGTLYGKLNEQQKIATEYIGDNAFIASSVKARLEFSSTDEGFDTLTLKQGGRSLHFKRQKL